MYNRCLDDFKLLLTLWSPVVPYVGLYTLLNFCIFCVIFLVFIFLQCRFMWAYTPWFFVVRRRTTSVKTTSSNRSVVKSTWLEVNWSEKLRTEWSLYSKLVDKLLLFISNLLKCNRDKLNLVDRRILSSWQQMVARSIRVRLWGEEDVYYFLPLTFNPSYVMLDGMGLCCSLCCLKEWCWLCLPNLHVRTS